MLKWLKRKSPESDVEKRTYFEVYGDYLAMNQTLKQIGFGLLAINVLLLILLQRAIRRPPLVIRFTDVGMAEAVKDISATNRISKVEVLNFVKLFMKFFLERNHYTWKDDLAAAGLMMTPDFRHRINSQLDFNREVTAIDTNKLSTKLKFSNIEITRDTPDAILISLKGWRQISSYDDPAYLKETVFEAELGLRKMPRTEETPYGLLVDSYKQMDFKNE
jgi:hypothetical protein